MLFRSLERPRFAIRRDVREYFDESVLDRLVSFGSVSEVLICNPRRAALVEGDEGAEMIARRVQVLPLNETADLDGQLRILGQLGRDGPSATPRRGGRTASKGPIGVESGPRICTHKGTTT